MSMFSNKNSGKVYIAPPNEAESTKELEETINPDIVIKTSGSITGRQILPPLEGVSSAAKLDVNTEVIHNPNPNSTMSIQSSIRNSRSCDNDNIQHMNSNATVKKVVRGSFPHIRPTEALSIYNVVQSLVDLDESKPKTRVKFCILEAEPGMGRSQAANYFVELARSNGISYRVVVALHGDEAVPYGVLKKVFFELIGWDQFSTEEQQKEVLEGILKSYIEVDVREVTLKNIKSVLGLVWKNDPQARVAQVNARINDMSHVEHIFISLLDERKRCVAIDDSHFCDELSWNELEIIINATTRVSFMLTTQTLSDIPIDRRSFEGPRSQLSPGATFDADYELKQKMLPTDSYLRLQRLPFCTRITLRAINTHPIFTDLFVSSYAESLPHEIMLKIYYSSQGNPFWIHFIIRFINDYGKEAYVASYPSAERESPNNSIDFLIDADIKKLDPAILSIALICSIIGEGFTQSMLQSLLIDEEEIANLSSNLDALIKKRYIKGVNRRNEVAFEFEHPLLRKTLYDQISVSDAAEYHFRIAHLIVEHYSEDLRPYFSRLTYHYGKIQGKRSDAFKYTVKAADQAVRRGAYTDGLASAQRAAKMALSALEYRVLINVVERAQEELRGRHTLDLDSKFEDQKLEAYALLLSSLQAGLEDINAERQHRRSPDASANPLDPSTQSLPAHPNPDLNTPPFSVRQDPTDSKELERESSSDGLIRNGDGCRACIVS